MAACFLEIFSGSGHLGRAVALAKNVPTLLWDISMGPEYDLLKRSNQFLILSWIESGRILGIHLGVPCNSWSRARDIPGGPPPLRSDSEPMGFSDLIREGDRIAVRVGNALMFFAVRVCVLACFYHVAWSLENPARSRIWLAPRMKQLERRRGVSSVIVHYCMWGAPWRKPTKIISFLLDTSEMQNNLCLGAKRGMCRRTGKPHTVLQGQGPDGTFRTFRANPYPEKLCAVWARAFANSWISDQASRLSSILNRRGQRA